MNDGRKDVLVTHDGGSRLGLLRRYPAPPPCFGARSRTRCRSRRATGLTGSPSATSTATAYPDAVIADASVGLVRLRHVDDVSPTVAMTAPSRGLSLRTCRSTIEWTASDDAMLAASIFRSRWMAVRDLQLHRRPVPCCPPAARSCAWSPSLFGVRASASPRHGAWAGLGQHGASPNHHRRRHAPTLTVTAPSGGVAVRRVRRLADHLDQQSGAQRHDAGRAESRQGSSLETLAAGAPNTGSFRWAVAGPDASCGERAPDLNGLGDRERRRAISFGNPLRHRWL